MHVQELAENVPDMAHFRYVHGVGVGAGAQGNGVGVGAGAQGNGVGGRSVPVGLRADASDAGPVYRQRSLVGVAENEVAFAQQEAHGLGLVWLLTTTEPVHWLLTATTPVDEETCHLRVYFLVNEGGDATELRAATRATVEATMANVARDVPIWEHKAYVDRAPLVAEDGPIRLLRSWARQFYDD